MQMSDRDSKFLRAKTRPNYEDGSDLVRVVDLFSGCGGLTLGVAEACRSAGRGLELRLAMELDERVRKVFDSNFTSLIARERGNVLSRFDGALGQKVSLQERMTAKEVGEVDILVGGPPCQGHSDLNNHSRRNDPKNELYMVMVRATEVLQPNHVVIENVHGVQRDRSAVLERAIRGLEDLGYAVDGQLVRMIEIGVPQRRVRHVLFASKTVTPSIRQALARAHVAKARSLAWAIKDLVSINSSSHLDVAASLSPANAQRAKYLQETRTFDLPNLLRPPCHRDNPNHRYTAMYGRLKWTEPAHTITTGFGSPGQGRYLHPDKLRTLTPHEAARLQFFPDWFDFSKAAHRSVVAHCIGNAVPAKLSFVLASFLLSLESAATGTSPRAVG